MSKSKTEGSESSKGKNRAAEILAAMTKSGAAKVKRLAGSTKFWFFLGVTIAMVSSLMANIPEGLSLGLLYLMPDGEAKSGRTGSVVYMRNGRRRNFVVPALVQNAYTTGQRASFSSLSSAFKALTAAQIAAWNSASGFFRSNRFGQSKEVKGKALFIMLNQNLFNIGEALINDPPLPDAVPQIDDVIIVVEVDPAATNITFTPTPTDANVTHMVFATAPLSPGISKPGNSQFRLITTIPGATASPFVFGNPYQAKFGVPTPGMKTFVKLVPVNATTGQTGAGIVGSTIVVP